MRRRAIGQPAQMLMRATAGRGNAHPRELARGVAVPPLDTVRRAKEARCAKCRSASLADPRRSVARIVGASKIVATWAAAARRTCSARKRSACASRWNVADRRLGPGPGQRPHQPVAPPRPCFGYSNLQPECPPTSSSTTCIRRPRACAAPARRERGPGVKTGSAVPRHLARRQRALAGRARQLRSEGGRPKRMLGTMSYITAAQTLREAA